MMGMNRNGHPGSLGAARPGNANAVRFGVYSRRSREPRAQQVADELMRAPHATQLDHLGALEIGRIEALIEALDASLAADGVWSDGAGTVRAAVDLRLRASRRLLEWLDRFAATPRGRAELERRLAEGGLAAEIARRRSDVLEQRFGPG